MTEEVEEVLGESSEGMDLAEEKQDNPVNER